VFRIPAINHRIDPLSPLPTPDHALLYQAPAQASPATAHDVASHIRRQFQSITPIITANAASTGIGVA
jgi:hypothetical protein